MARISDRNQRLDDANVEFRQMDLEAALLEEIEQTLAGGIAAISSFAVFVKSLSRVRSNLTAIRAALAHNPDQAYDALASCLQQTHTSVSAPARQMQPMVFKLNELQLSVIGLLEAVRDRIHVAKEQSKPRRRVAKSSRTRSTKKQSH